MLFDLQGKRKVFVKIIYAGLALLIGGGLVLFGIGGAGNGGLLDALGIGGGSPSSSATYDNQIERANQTLASQPKDERALLTLSRYEFLTAQEQLETDDKGQPLITADAFESYTRSVDAWERYLATKPDKPDDNVATLVYRAYQYTLDQSSPSILKDVGKVADVAKIIADARPGFVNDSTLAYWAYIAGDQKTGAAAVKRAAKDATDPSQRKQLKSIPKSATATHDALVKQVKKGSSTGSGSLPNPTAGLGGPASSLLPGSSVPPASPAP